jgi:uncharacterized protein (DUF2141 family)
MVNKSAFFILIIVLAFLSPVKASGQRYHITVKITGLKSSKGKIVLSLYNSDNGYPQSPEKAFRIVSQVIANNACTVLLDDIPSGAYAIACFHDENDNGKLEKNFIGIPVEGVGASNNAKGFMGPPKFNDARFVVEKDIDILIKIDY